MILWRKLYKKSNKEIDGDSIIYFTFVVYKKADYFLLES